MRARLTLILILVAACATVGPAAPAPAEAHGGRGPAGREQAQLVAHLRHTQRARLAAVAKQLTAEPTFVAEAEPEPEPEPQPEPEPTPAPVPAPDVAAAALVPSSYIWPAKARIASPFGPRGRRRHDGVDIMAPHGAPIVAAQAGTVTKAGWQNGYGNTIEIAHGNGVTTKYAHQSRMVARVGQHLDQGEVLGFVGSTGRVTAPHLHYEVHVNGVPRNPASWL